jgi:methyltransferase-like protein/SAM-dependent methyltransferase
MPDLPATTYDQLQYGDLVFQFSHPANIAMVASLHGLKPPPVERCRVLDLGCAAGANLWPMALALPESEFVGLDLSSKQIDRGRETVAALGLSNLTLHARNVIDSTDDLGQFDYIITHGVFSWVPPAVQDRILEMIHRQLAPDGLAYVSYNVYPGWQLRGMLRDMLMFHAGGAGEPATQVAEARSYLNFLLSALSDTDSAVATILRGEAEMLLTEDDSYLFHDYLEADNRPMYFHQFVAHAAAHGLQYLAEAAPQALPSHIKPEVVNALAAASPDRIRLEQHLDFLRCRIFRRSLLCHAAARPDFNGAAGRVPALFVSSEARPEADLSNAFSTPTEHFATPNELRFSTADPGTRAVLRRLWDARPAAVPFADVLAAVHAAAPNEDGLPERLAGAMLQLYLSDIVTLHLYPPTLAPVAGTRPCASRLARFQAAHGAERVHDLRHRAAHPDTFARYLLPLLDGSRDRSALVEVLAARATAGEFEVRDAAGQPATDPALVRQVLAAWVEDALERLAKAALLLA